MKAPKKCNKNMTLKLVMSMTSEGTTDTSKDPEMEILRGLCPQFDC